MVELFLLKRPFWKPFLEGDQAQAPRASINEMATALVALLQEEQSADKELFGGPHCHGGYAINGQP